jgi:hypothetical protein
MDPGSGISGTCGWTKPYGPDKSQVPGFYYRYPVTPPETHDEPPSLIGKGQGKGIRADIEIMNMTILEVDTRDAVRQKTSYEQMVTLRACCNRIRVEQTMSNGMMSSVMIGILVAREALPRQWIAPQNHDTILLLGQGQYIVTHTSGHEESLPMHTESQALKETLVPNRCPAASTGTPQKTRRALCCHEPGHFPQ